MSVICQPMRPRHVCGIRFITIIYSFFMNNYNYIILSKTLCLYGLVHGSKSCCYGFNPRTELCIICCIGVVWVVFKLKVT